MRSFLHRVFLALLRALVLVTIPGAVQSKMSRMKQRSVSSSVSSSVDFGAAAATMILEQHGSPLEKETSISQPNNPWTRRRKTWLWLATLAGVIGLLHQGESIHRDLRRLAAQNTLEPQPAHFYREQFGPVHRPHHYSVSIRTEVHPFGDAVARAHAPIAPNWSTKPFLGFDNQTGSPAREHTLSLFPRLASLDAFPADQHVNAEDIVFAFATDVARIRKMAPSWKHFLRQGSSCLIVLPPVQRKRHGEVAKILAEHGLSRCKSITSDVDAKSYPRYEHRMLNMPQALLAQDWRTEDDRELHPRWYIVLDDDTHVLDMGILLRELSSRQFTQPNLLCGTSESIGQLRHAGRICYGGAGIIFSQALLQSMVDVLPKCFNKFRNITGGDAMLTACAALAQNTKVEQIMTDVPSLHREPALYPVCLCQVSLTAWLFLPAF